MPLARFKSDELDKTARMFSPTRITSELAWLKEARKVIPQIPDPMKTDWRIASTQISLKTVKFTLVNSVGKSSTLTIDRMISSFG